MVNKRILGAAALACLLSMTMLAGAEAADELSDDHAWQVAPGSLGSGANLAREWIQPSPTGSP